MAKVIRRSNLTVVTRTYTDNQGNQKSVWNKIGELTTFQKDDGTYSTMCELYHMPGVKISVFENKPKEQAQAPQQYQQPSPAPQQPVQPAVAQAINTFGGHEVPEEEIRVENIPF